MNYFVTAIGTDSGKTVVSAIVAEMLGADYWKPVQAGFPTDTDTVNALVTNPEIKFFPERHLLKTPASPHAAAILDGVQIKMEDFQLPHTSGDLIVEGAGGALVPLNDDDFVIDLAQRFNSEVIVVSNLYLGSINHTLTTAESLERRKLKIKGVVFNGETNPESERIILHKTGWKKLLHLQNEKEINKQIVSKYAAELKQNW